MVDLVSPLRFARSLSWYAVRAVVKDVQQGKGALDRLDAGENRRSCVARHRWTRIRVPSSP